MKTWKTWTDHDLAALEQLRLDGLSIAAIAAALGRTHASIANRLREEAIRKPRPDRWLNAMTKPHTIAGLASEFGVTKHAVKQAKRKLRRAGFDIPDARR